MSEPTNTVLAAVVGCHNCSTRVAKRGTPPKSGVYFCGSKECRAAKARFDRALRYEGIPGRMEDRPCSHCGIEMSPRPWRITDLEEGRYCRKTKCQEVRQKINKVRSGSVSMEQVHSELFLDARKRGWVHCHDCGMEYGVQGYMHPKPDGSEPCESLGTATPDMEQAAWTWPEVFLKDDPHRLEQRLMTLRANGLRPEEVIPSD